MAPEAATAAVKMDVKETILADLLSKVALERKVYVERESVKRANYRGEEFLERRVKVLL